LVIRVTTLVAFRLIWEYLLIQIGLSFSIKQANPSPVTGATVIAYSFQRSRSKATIHSVSPPDSHQHQFSIRE